MVSHGILLALLTMASSFHPLPTDNDQVRRETTKHNVAAKSRAKVEKDGTLSGLPYAFGRTFGTLDAYLLHLQQVAAPVDLPWWRKVSADRFERMTGKKIPQGHAQFATRAELAQKYGFDR